MTIKELISNPSPTPYAHVCSLSESPDGEVFATWQGGTSEKAPDSSIWSSRRGFSKSSKWSAPQKIVEITAPYPTCVMNAVQWRDISNMVSPICDHISLVFHMGGGSDGYCDIQQWVPYVARSVDAGLNWWIEPLEQFEPGVGLMGPVKNQCLKLSNGEVLCPSSTETSEMDTAHFETTDITMTHWTKRSDIKVESEDRSSCNDMVQPVIFEKASAPGSLYALFRTDCGSLASASSPDYGHTWPAEASVVPALTSTSAGLDGVVLETMKDGSWLIAWNNSTVGRTPLTLATSDDEGESWQHLIDLETDPNGSFAYPYLLESKWQRGERGETVVHLCYSFSNATVETMAYARIEFL